jgi:hypothetical protein
MLRCRRPLSRLTATVAATALSLGLLAATPGSAWASDKTTYLGLEGEGGPVTALSDALRWDLDQRGRDDGNTMSLAELKLTMGCGDDDFACLAQGGQALGSEEFVFGRMSPSASGWTLELIALDVATGKVIHQVSRELSDAELATASVAKTATSLVDQLYGLAPAPADVPPPSSDPSGDEGEDELGETDLNKPSARRAEPRDSGGLVWGPYKPRPTWKLVGVGVSGTLTVAALATAIGTTVAISPNGPVRNELLAAAEASLTDDRPSNDIDPNTNEDLCPLARAAPDPTRPNEVTNAAMTRICAKADNLAVAATASWIATGVFAASTVVFTTLLFVHKDKPEVAKLIEHDVGFGGAPLQAGGFVLGGSFRF